MEHKHFYGPIFIKKRKGLSKLRGIKTSSINFFIRHYACIESEENKKLIWIKMYWHVIREVIEITLKTLMGPLPLWDNQNKKALAKR